MGQKPQVDAPDQIDVLITVADACTGEKTRRVLRLTPQPVLIIIGTDKGGHMRHKKYPCCFPLSIGAQRARSIMRSGHSKLLIHAFCE